MPGGAYIAHFWHPRLRPGAPELLQKVTIGDGETRVTIALPVLPEKQDDGEKDRY